MWQAQVMTQFMSNNTTKELGGTPGVAINVTATTRANSAYPSHPNSWSRKINSSEKSIMRRNLITICESI